MAVANVTVQFVVGRRRRCIQPTVGVKSAEVLSWEVVSGSAYGVQPGPRGRRRMSRKVAVGRAKFERRFRIQFR